LGGSISAPTFPTVTTGPSGSGLTFPIGTYTATITSSDLTSAGITDQTILNQNSGDFTMMFTPDRSWRLDQQSTVPIDTPTLTGFYEASGDQLKVTVTSPEQWDGYAFPLTWRVDGDQLVFSPTSAMTEPTDQVLWSAHPWAKKS
jgi:hypothetical protein